MIDLSDNEILKMDNFPQLLNLKILLLSNNKIYKISEGLGDSLKNITTLILNNNQITVQLTFIVNIEYILIYFRNYLIYQIYVVLKP